MITEMRRDEIDIVAGGIYLPTNGANIACVAIGGVTTLLGIAGVSVFSFVTCKIKEPYSASKAAQFCDSNKMLISSGATTIGGVLFSLFAFESTNTTMTNNTLS